MEEVSSVGVVVAAAVAVAAGGAECCLALLLESVGSLTGLVAREEGDCSPRGASSSARGGESDGESTSEGGGRGGSAALAEGDGGGGDSVAVALEVVGSSRGTAVSGGAPSERRRPLAASVEFGMRAAFAEQSSRVSLTRSAAPGETLGRPMIASTRHN